MSPQDILLKRLGMHPELTIRQAPGLLRIEPRVANGFAVELHSHTQRWTVYLGDAGFHKTFDDPEEVLNFVAWCFSGNARVREEWRGHMPVKAILEASENGSWNEAAETGYFFFPFWRKRKEVTLTNPELLRN